MPQDYANILSRPRFFAFLWTPHTTSCMAFVDLCDTQSRRCMSSKVGQRILLKWMNGAQCRWSVYRAESTCHLFAVHYQVLDVHRLHQLFITNQIWCLFKHGRSIPFKRLHIDLSNTKHSWYPRKWRCFSTSRQELGVYRGPLKVSRTRCIHFTHFCTNLIISAMLFAPVLALASYQSLNAHCFVVLLW